MASPLDARLVRLERGAGATPWDALLGRPVAEWGEERLAEMVAASDARSGAVITFIRKISDSQLDDLVTVLRAEVVKQDDALSRGTDDEFLTFLGGAGHV